MKMTLQVLCITLFCLVLFAKQAAAQQKPLSIHFIAPKQMEAGESIQLKVQVKHHLTKEQTGHLQLSLLNSETKKSVDGWFLNFFPFQYFTTIANEIFETEFPFTVPHEFKGKFDLALVAKVDTIQDSVQITIPTYIKQ
jgi:hypothetical protein